MGKILYGVMGDSGGHLSRSLAISRKLKGHEIVFVGGGRVREVRQYGYDVEEVPLLATQVSGTRVDLLATVENAARLIAGRSGVVRRLQGLIRSFEPDLILSDYEYYLPLAAKKLARPCIGVDRQHVLTHCRYQTPPGHVVSRLTTQGIIRSLYGACTHHMLSSFVPMQPLDAAKTEIFAPVLRPEVENTAPADGEHAVVYLYGTPISWIRDVLGGRKRRFVIYGQKHVGDEGNLSFRPASVEGFLDDLAGAAYVMSHCGHNLISEALHLGKPLLCLPIDWEYEQYFNAQILSKAGYGAWGQPKQGSTLVEAFEARLPEYAANAAAYQPWSGQSVTGRLEQLLAEGV